jgi:hypothetical protein
MNAEIALYHLWELGVKVCLSDDLRGLELDAPAGVLTPELLELLAPVKPELVDLLYAQIEAEAIAWEGCVDEKPRGVVKFIGDPLLVSMWERNPTIQIYANMLSGLGGGEILIEKEVDALDDNERTERAA